MRGFRGIQSFIAAEGWGIIFFVAAVSLVAGGLIWHGVASIEGFDEGLIGTFTSLSLDIVVTVAVVETLLRRRDRRRLARVRSTVAATLTAAILETLVIFCETMPLGGGADASMRKIEAARRGPKPKADQVSLDGFNGILRQAAEMNKNQGGTGLSNKASEFYERAKPVLAHIQNGTSRAIQVGEDQVLVDLLVVVEEAQMSLESQVAAHRSATARGVEGKALRLLQSLRDCYEKLIQAS